MILRREHLGRDDRHRSLPGKERSESTFQTFGSLENQGVEIDFGSFLKGGERFAYPLV